jgi:hypothetical protein
VLEIAVSDMAKPRFDPTVHLGHIITFVGFVVTAVGGWYVVDYRLMSVERQIERLSSVIIQQARIEEWQKNTERRLDRLEVR